MARRVQEQITLVPLTNTEALKEFLSFSIPYVVSRSPMAILWFSEGIILNKLGENASLAGPTISAAKGFAMGISQGFMMIVGVLSGKLISAGQKLANSNPAESHKKFREAANISRQSWTVAIPLAAATGVSLSFLSSILSLVHVDLSSEIKAEITRYFRYYAFSLLPTFWAVSDRSLLMANEKKTEIIIFGLAPAAVSVAIGYPLALYTDFGIEGIGIGVLISSTLNIIALRSYIQKKFPELNIFSFKDIPPLMNNIKEFLRHGAGASLSSLTERVNIAVIATFAASMGATALAATQVSIQLILPYSFIIYAFGQAAGVLISRKMGLRELAIQRGDHQSKKIYEKNIRKIGYANVAFNTILGLTTGAIIAFLAEPFSELFITNSITEAQKLLLINCIGTPIDAMRATLSGGLRGFKDTLFSPIISLIFMSLIGLSVTAGVIYGEESPPIDWLFDPRVVGLLVSVLIIGVRWDISSRFLDFSDEEESPMLTVNDSDNHEEATASPEDRSCVERLYRFFLTPKKDPAINREESTPLLSPQIISQNP